MNPSIFIIEELNRNFKGLEECTLKNIKNQ